MTTTPTSPGGALHAAVGIWRQALARAWAPLLIYAAVYAVGLVVRLPTVAILLLIPTELLVWTVVSGALMRIALGELHPDDPAFRLGPVGLQWTGIETRLLGARLLLILLLFLALTAAVFCMLLAGVVVAAMTGQPPTLATAFFLTPSGMAISLVGLAFAVLTGWVATRLALSNPATADRGQVQAFSTWSLTAGRRAWRVLFWMPLLIFGGFVLGFLIRWLDRTNSVPSALMPVVWIAYALLLGFVQTPLAAGVSAYAYRRLSAEAEAAAPHN